MKKILNNEELRQFIERHHPNFIDDLNKYSDNGWHQLGLFVSTFDVNSMLLNNVIIDNGKLMRIINGVRTTTEREDIVFDYGYLYDLGVLFDSAEKFMVALKRKNYIESFKRKLIANDNKIENIKFEFTPQNDSTDHVITSLHYINRNVVIKTSEDLEFPIETLTLNTMYYLWHQINK